MHYFPIKMLKLYFHLLWSDSAPASRGYPSAFPHFGIALFPPYRPLLVSDSPLHFDEVPSSH